MQRHLSFVASFVFGLLALFAMTIFTVDQRQFAIIFQLGEIKEVVSEPGLAFKWPLIQNVKIFDKRILTLDSPEPERFLTAEKKPVLVDSFVKWRIHDVKQYYVSVSGDETLAKTRLSQTVNAGLREEFGRRTVHDVVSGARDDIMVVVKKKADAEMRAIGVEIVDVRLKRVDLPPEVSESVYRRMETERKRVASELRAEGAAEAEKIKANAAGIYGRAFGENAEFYAFYRSLEAYRGSFRNKSDLMVIEPNSEFFKYLKNSGKGK